MSRTYRARHDCYNGFVMHDGLKLRQHGEDADWYKFVFEPGHPHMNWYGNERKDYRKWWQTRHRARIRQAMHRGDWENLPQWRRTGGWLTW
jgi:hypothetical protein